MSETPRAPEAEASKRLRSKAPPGIGEACDEIAGAALALAAVMPDIRDVATGEVLPHGPVPERRAERAAWLLEQHACIARAAPVVIDAVRGPGGPRAPGAEAVSYAEIALAAAVAAVEALRRAAEASGTDVALAVAGQHAVRAALDLKRAAAAAAGDFEAYRAISSAWEEAGAWLAGGAEPGADPLARAVEAFGPYLDSVCPGPGGAARALQAFSFAMLVAGSGDPPWLPTALSAEEKAAIDAARADVPARDPP